MTNNIVSRMNGRWVGGGMKLSELMKEQKTHTYTHKERVNSISQNNLHLAPAFKTHQMQTHLMAALDDKWHRESISGL